MARTKLKFRLHRTVIVLFCLTLLVALIQGASWFSQSHQRQHDPQLEELTRTPAHQVTLNVTPLMRTGSPDEKYIRAILDQLTDESCISDVGVYDGQGDLVTHSSESVEMCGRLAPDGKKTGGHFSQQIVEPTTSENRPLGYLRLTLDIHTFVTEAQRVDNTINILRLALLLSLAVGVVLTHTLLQGRHTRWQQSPFLLTTSKSVPKEEGGEKKEWPITARKEIVMSTLRPLIFDSYDPWSNPTVEECIFRQMPATQRVLFLWRSADTIVVGRAQNPWKECNTRRMEEDNVRLARRSSGGGVVFHDLGNTCFTFMADKPEHDKTISTSIVLNTPNALGVNAEASGCNDLVVRIVEGDRRVSGSAYHGTKDRGFHHGTLLLNANLSHLANYLNPDKRKLAAKGITSVRSRVTDLTELLPGITHGQVCEVITEAFSAHYGKRVETEIISPNKTPDLPNFAETFARQSSWKWNFGQAPAFSHLLGKCFTWGGAELHFDVEKGHITCAQMFTDSLNPVPLEALAGQLQGCLYRVDMLQQECRALLVNFPEQEKGLRKLPAWIAGTIR